MPRKAEKAENAEKAEKAEETEETEKTKEQDNEAWQQSQPGPLALEAFPDRGSKKHPWESFQF